AAMLDMAFQLLAFFTATFNPPPEERQISLRLPPPQAVTPQGKSNAGEAPKDEIAKGLNTLTINIGATADNSGNLGQMQVGDTNVGSVAALKETLRGIFNQPAVPYEQIVLQVDTKLRYEELMKVVSMCSDLDIPDPMDPAKKKKMNKLSF